MPRRTWLLTFAAVAATALSLPCLSHAQEKAADSSAASGFHDGGLPSVELMNLLGSGRSGLYFSALREPARGWRGSIAVDYASAIEWERKWGDYLMDAELLRVNLAVQRDLWHRFFVTASANLNYVHDGFADRVIDWYHEKILHYRMRGRDERPLNEFGFHVYLPGRDTIRWDRGGFYAGDARAELGARLGRWDPNSTASRGQLLLSFTLPTSTGPDGYGRDAVSANLLGGLRKPLGLRFVYEAGAGVGYTPARGPLADLARTVFVSASSGIRVRAWRSDYFYLNVLWHSRYFAPSSIRELSASSLGFDFGYIRRRASGVEWWLGMTEDSGANDPGIDLVVRTGVRW